MDIKAVKLLKAKLETDILKAIQHYENETGLAVDDISLTKCQSVGSEYGSTAVVQVSCRIN